MTHLRRNYCYTLLSLLAVCLSFTACVPEGIELPSRVKSIATDVATSVTSNGAKLCGVVSVYDTDTISCGIIYDTSSTLSSTSGTLKPTSANGKYSVPIGGLKANTTYYYRAYALDAGVYKYGEVLSFATSRNVTICTGDATDVTTNGATLSGTVSGTDEAISCGFIYGTSSDMSSANNNRTEASSNGTYSVSISNLQANTTYYYCAYTIIDGEEKHGEVLSFTTFVDVTKTTYTVNGVSFTMIEVEEGTFIMGSPDSDSDAYSNEKPTHQVTLSSYSIGETEVTQALWQAVMGSNPSSITGDLQRPVESVSWNDCQTFISKLNELTGENFRLPTEAEWEYAARGGNKSKGYKYSGSNTVDDVAWYWDNSTDGTKAVKTKQPNELGIYDMSGNVWEWCSDWYGSYSSSAQINPIGPSSGSARMLRGGGWHYIARYCRVASRNGPSPDRRFYSFGLRLVCSDASLQVVTIETGEATDITTNGARLSGTVSGTDVAISCGFIYGTTSDISSMNNRIREYSNRTYYFNIFNLQPNTIYYYCAYAIIDGEERYGEVCSFTTEQEAIVNGTKTTYTVNGVSFTMIGVEGGAFTMGSPDSDSDSYSDEKPAHQVTLSNYSIGETEVTQALWQAVMGSNPSYITGDLQRPVESVSWNDCQDFINRLNELTGESFRLPTEAEWEYAARGGKESKGYKYSGSNTVNDVAWSTYNSSSETHAVKTKQPNELGIYDMTGNVWEWCSDWYGSYSSSWQFDPTGPSSGSRRVLRGGSWSSYASSCRVAHRFNYSPDGGSNGNGFRLSLQFIP